MKEVFRTNALRGVCILMLVCVFAVAGFAQSTTLGAIGGTVTDSTKAVISNAEVTVTNTGTQQQKTGITDSFGKFRVVGLDPGTYTVAVSSASFSKYRAEGVVVEVGRITEVEVALAATGTSETVTVTSEAPTVNTIQQDFASNLDQSAINNLPINGRRWSTFVLLTPGVTTDGGFGLISFRGISGLLNNNTVDGGDNNQAFFSEERGRTRANYTVSQSSIREFQVNTSNYSAEYGRAAGGVVNSVTKSGTNNIHGEGFWYIRDNSLGATNPYTTKTVFDSASSSYVPVPFKPDDRRQQYGGSIGGPVVKDKLFFFFTYDGSYRNFPGVAQATNATSFFAPLSPAELATLSGTGASQSQINDAFGFLAAETGTVPRTGTQDIFFPKVDWKINQNHTFTASYNRMRWNSPAGIQTQPTVGYAVNSFGNDYVKTDMLNLRLTSTLTSMMTNELRYQWGRDFEFETSQEPSAAESQYGLAQASGGRPSYITITGATGALNMGRANFLERTAYPDERRHQASDTASLAMGHHFLKFGFDFDRNNDLLDNLFNGGGTFAYTSRGNFLKDLLNNQLGHPSKSYSTFSQAFGPTAIDFNTYDTSFFFQDDWKLTPRLTLNLGLRWEYEMMPIVPQGYVNPLIPQTGKLPSDNNNFGPRVGFAWDVFGDGKTAVRGGYGMYYGRINNGAIAGALFSNGSKNAQLNFTGITPATAGAPTFPDPYFSFASLPAALVAKIKPNGFYFDPNLQNPQIHQADLIVERELGHNMAISVNYLLSLGHELPNFIDQNVAPSTSNTQYVVNGGPFDGKTFTVPFYSARTNPLIGALIDETSNVNSNYNALVVAFNRKMTHGLQVMTNYTWSHALDYGQGSQTQTASFANTFAPGDVAGEYGTSSLDRRHRFVATAVWAPETFKNSSKVTKAILNGWSFAPIVTLASGQPYTESISGNSFNQTTLASNFGVGGGINGSGGVFRLAPLTGKNAWNFPAFYNTDFRVSRRFAITERQSVEILAEAFNLFNHPNATTVNQLMYTTSTKNAAGVTNTPGAPINLNFATDPLTSLPLFGTVTQAGTNQYRERQVQFAIRYSF